MHRSFPAHSVKELIALAKKAPKKYTYASAGIGTPVHLGGALFGSMAGVELVHVPYKGAAGLYHGIAGRACRHDVRLGARAADAHQESGAVRPLAATTAVAHRGAAGPADLAESGLAGYNIASWYGIFAPMGTPERIVSLLQAEIARAIKTKPVARAYPITS